MRDRSDRSPPTETLEPHIAGRTGVLHLWEPGELVAALGVNNHICSPTAIARVDVQRELGPYRDALKHAGDLEMWLRFALNGRVGYLDACQAVYRRHDRNMSSGYRGYADFSQRVLTFDLHAAGIRALMPNGRTIEREIRRRLASQAVRLLRRALFRGHMDEFFELCLYPVRGMRSR
jgi:hypothetical protein